MPLYHTMGVRSLIAMALVDGAFICLPHFDAPSARLDFARQGDQPLSGPDALPRPDQPPGFRRDRHGLGHQARLRRRGDAGWAAAPGRRGVSPAAFRQSLWLVGDLHLYDRAGCSGEAGLGRAGRINQRIRVVRLGTSETAAPGEEGEIVADATNDEAFDGYWRRPDADARALRDGWYFTGDTGYVDADGDVFVTGRVDDMIITGGENVSPGEIESVLSLNPAVAEVAVAGLPDERWGQIVTGFVRRVGTVDAAALDRWCRRSSLADYKRPRRYVFVAEIPKSPVGKILRRLLGRRRLPPGVSDARRVSAIEDFRVEIDAGRSAATSCSTGRRST